MTVALFVDGSATAEEATTLQSKVQGPTLALGVRRLNGATGMLAVRYLDVLARPPQN